MTESATEPEADPVLKRGPDSAPIAAPTWQDRIFALPGIDNWDGLEAKARLFQISMLLDAALYAWGYAADFDGGSRFMLAMLFAPLLVALSALVQAGHSRVANALALAMLFAMFFPYWPGHANHFYVHMYMLGVALVAGDKTNADRALLLSTARWIIIVVLVGSGLQKLAHGTYLNGDYIIHLMMPGAKGAWFLSSFIGADDYYRLLDIIATNSAGPLVVDSPIVIAFGYMIVFGEIFIPLLLLHKRTRVAGIWGLVGLIIGIEVIAREFVFGILVVVMLFQFFPENRNREALAIQVLLSLVYMFFSLFLPFMGFN